ncbi:MAG: hypothetical protein Q4B03_08385 [Lachnospiraceae bacterium]|nr:hypothetical protein [Lachnospiraceae bacterium]
MIDIHSHIIPLVDDGSQDMDESVEMVRLSADSGVKILVATPHANQRGRFENYYQRPIKEKFIALKQAVQEAGIDIRLLFGMEIYSSYEIPDLIANGLLSGLNCSDYYLVEFPFEADLGYMYYSIGQIFDAGGIPVIAHPERYTHIQRSTGILYDWIQEGVCVQVNKGSVFGSFGPAAKKAAEFIFAHELATCVGSDAHGTEVRTTDMSQLRDYLLKNCGEEYTTKATRQNPLLLLKNQDVPAHGIQPHDLDTGNSGARRRRFLF